MHIDDHDRLARLHGDASNAVLFRKGHRSDEIDEGVRIALLGSDVQVTIVWPDQQHHTGIEVR